MVGVTSETRVSELSASVLAPGTPRRLGLVLLSGGLDSTTVAAALLER